MTKLSIEQQFQVAAFKSQISQMTLEQTQELLVKLHEEMIIKEAAYLELLKHHWGLVTD